MTCIFPYAVNLSRRPVQLSLFSRVQIDYPEIVDGVLPRHRFMAAYEQKVEPPDKKWQYLLFAAEPYETIAFKVIRTLKSQACWTPLFFLGR